MADQRRSPGYRWSPSTIEAVHAAAAERGISPSWLAERLVVESLARLIPADEFRLTREP